MLSCAYIGSSFPGGKKNNKKFFALLPRLVSDNITHEIIKRLGFSDACCYTDPGNNIPDLYATYKRLPQLSYTTASYQLLQAHALFSKNGDMVTDVDKRAVAYESFLQSETSCKLINDELADGSFYRKDNRIANIMMKASEYIAYVLGPCPSIDELDGAFGPGACVSDRDCKITTPSYKLTGTLVISKSLIPKLDEVRDSLPKWFTYEDSESGLRRNREIQVATGRLDFVPKSFKTDRSIMIEPVVNGFLQKGVGKYLKRKLYARGIDLTDQSYQRERARLGSIDGSYTTVDLSRASDSISWHLVMDLLPWDWFDLLDCLRTPEVCYDKKLITLEKFSSMGNGFTFELETLIFKALIHGIADTHNLKDDSMCYGDDITCNASLGLAIAECFPLFGFQVNVDKSFFDGCFREACGGDYRNGIDIRPFFLRSIRDGGRWTIAKLYSFHNFLKKKPWFDFELSKFVLSFIPDDMKLWGPPGVGDGVLVSLAHPSTYLRRKDDTSAKRRRHTSYEGYLYRQFIMEPHRVDPNDHNEWISSYAAYAGLSKDGVYDASVARYPKGSFLPSRVVTSTFIPGFHNEDYGTWDGVVND